MDKFQQENENIVIFKKQDQVEFEKVKRQLQIIQNEHVNMIESFVQRQNSDEYKKQKHIQIEKEKQQLQNLKNEYQEIIESFTQVANLQKLAVNNVFESVPNKKRCLFLCADEQFITTNSDDEDIFGVIGLNFNKNKFSEEMMKKDETIYDYLAKNRINIIKCTAYDNQSNTIFFVKFTNKKCFKPETDQFILEHELIDFVVVAQANRSENFTKQKMISNEKQNPTPKDPFYLVPNRNFAIVVTKSSTVIREFFCKKFEDCQKKLGNNLVLKDPNFRTYYADKYDMNIIIKNIYSFCVVDCYYLLVRFDSTEKLYETDDKILQQDFSWVDHMIFIPN